MTSEVMGGQRASQRGFRRYSKRLATKIGHERGATGFIGWEKTWIASTKRNRSTVV